MHKNHDQQLIIFIKAPEPGQCKTRLTPFLSPQQACNFYKILVEHCMNNTASLKATDIAIYTTPDAQHPYIINLSQKYNTTLHRQQGKNLGERMHHALAESLLHYKRSILIGSDCPELDTKYIEKAFKALKQHDKVTDIVLGPAEDGGYVLIGASRIQAELFNNISWGSDNVLQQTLKKLDIAGYRYQRLNTLRDIDSPEDYIHYQSQIISNKKNQQET